MSKGPNLVLLLLCALNFAWCEVSLLKSVQTIYDASPKLRIRGSGFTANDKDISLELGVLEQPLITGKDYLVTKDADGDGLILKLLGNRRWADFTKSAPPLPLVLSQVIFASEPGKNQLPQPAIISQVLSTPYVNENTQIIHVATSELRISGSGWIGAKKLDLFFDPPIITNVQYEDATAYPLTKNEVTLRLRNGYKWREDSGPLVLVGVDAGGGPVKQKTDGVTVAMVDAGEASPRILAPKTPQLLFADDPTLTITGQLLNPLMNTLTFANGLRGNRVNFSVVATSDTSITLRLEPGSLWISDTYSLPAPLTVTGLNVCEGFVAQGSEGRGVEVATIYERPQVYSSTIKVKRTLTSTFRIRGTGFAGGCYLRFDPPLSQGIHYTQLLLSRSELMVTLIPSRAWRDDIGSLRVTAINTRDPSSQWVALPGEGVHVAEIVGDDEDLPVQVDSAVQQRVYQSARHQNIVMTGAGFEKSMTLVLEPNLQAGIDYDLDVESPTRASLSLRPSKQWSKVPGGFIVVATVKIGKQEVRFGSGGVVVAEVLADPIVTETKSPVYRQTQSHLVSIQVAGITAKTELSIGLRPAESDAYKVFQVLDGRVLIQLLPGKAWLPQYMLRKEGDAVKIGLQVSWIDTGAGAIMYEDPPIVGYIAADRPGVTCEDSCVSAFNGVCEDETPLGSTGSSCGRNTDCTDCGGPDAIATDVCSNTCLFSRDGICDDPRGTKYCVLGTDCQDCGPVGADNFTRFDDEGAWWGDDNNPWDEFSGQILLAADDTTTSSSSSSLPPPPHHHRRCIRRALLVVAAVFFLCVLGLRKWMKGKNRQQAPQVEDVEVNPVSPRDVEMQKMKKNAIAPAAIVMQMQ